MIAAIVAVVGIAVLVFVVAALVFVFNQAKARKAAPKAPSPYYEGKLWAIDMTQDDSHLWVNEADALKVREAIEAGTPAIVEVTFYRLSWEKDWMKEPFYFSPVRTTDVVVAHVTQITGPCAKPMKKDDEAA